MHNQLDELRELVNFPEDVLLDSARTLHEQEQYNEEASTFIRDYDTDVNNYSFTSIAVQENFNKIREN